MGDGADDMELREASKDSMVSVDRISDQPKSSGSDEKNIANAYPSTSQQSEGASLRVGDNLIFFHEY